MNILITYASKKGSTQEISEFMAEFLEKNAYTVTVAHCDKVKSVAEYDAVILGTGIYSGRWLPAAETFLRRLNDELGETPFFYFLVCIRLLEVGGYEHVMQEYIPQYLINQVKNIQGATAFAGKLSYADIDWRDRWTLSVRYDGEATPIEHFVEDHRNWQKIQRWIEDVDRTLKVD